MVTTDLEVVPSHIETPDSIELKASAVASGCIGAWSVWPIGKDTVFGPYVGDIKKGKDLEDINYRYAWEVFDLETFGLLHVIDATDPSKGNWMRYVNCARYFEEQNIISVQQEDQVYYRAIKNIEPGEELLTWFEPRKKKRGRKRKMEKEAKEENVSATTDPSVAGHDKDDDSLGKRKRKPKIFPDSYQEIQLPRQKKLNKVLSSDSSQSETSANMVTKEKRKKVKENSELKESKDDTESETSSSCSSVVPERKDIFNNDSVSWDYPKPGEEYMFKLKKHHVVKVEGKRAYKCDICSGLYRHIFSLKRHYLKNHINYRYLCRTDVTNCLINLAQVLEAEKAAINRKESEELCVENENLSSNDAASDSGVGSSVNCASSKRDSSTDFRSSNDDLQFKNKGINLEDDTKSSLHDTGVEKLDDDTSSSVGDGISVSSEISKNSSAVKDNNCLEKGIPGGKDSEIVQRPGLYRCYLCFKLFETVVEIREHTVNHPKSKNHMPFACDKCEMRFSYIQNLVRHQAVHQANGSEHSNQVKKLSPGKGAKKMRTKNKDKWVDENTDIGKQEETNQEKKKSKLGSKECLGKVMNVLKGKSSKSAQKKYHCSRCSMKFGYLQNLVRHQQVHKDEKKTSPHSCEYCGKGFPSLSNMKKHVRFHLGYRISCRYCGDIHHNVGGLRKHIRIAHPEVHKAKLKKKLAKDGVLRKPDKKDIDKKSKASKIKDGAKDPTEMMEADKQKNFEEKEKKASSDELFSDNEISFAAEEIDDGGSRFKFACTICKRRFSSYINMCRHRRKAHDNESKHKFETSNSVGHFGADLPVVTETPEMVAMFYANVANNVAINMTSYIDGGQNSLQNYIDHIRIEDYDELPTEQEKSADIPWDRYNFPFDYKPTETMSYMEIKNKFKIRSEFEIQPENGVAISTNNVSDGCDRATDLNKVLLSGDDGKIEQVFIEEKTSESGASCKSQMSETEENGRCIVHSEELSDLKDLCNDGKTASLEQVFKPDTKRSFSESESSSSKENNENKDLEEKPSVECISDLTMDEVSAKELEIQKHEGLVSQAKKSLMKMASFPGKLCSSSSLYSGFELVLDGKYKNFENDILPSSFNTPLSKPLKARPWLSQGIGDNGSIENDIAVNEGDSRSPGECPDLGIGIFNQLQLVVTQQKLRDTTNTGDNYDDAKLSGSDDNLNHSPHYNFENIAFGKHGNITCVCGVCRKQFHDLDCLVRHHLKKHPSVAFNFLEVEQGNGIDLLHYSEPSNVGVLAVTSTGLESAIERDVYHCTGCGSVFKNVSRLHVHIVNCVSTSNPGNNSDSNKNKKKKTSLKSKIKKKLREIMNGSQNFRFRLKDFAGYKAEIFNMDGKQRKRIFTGCRKRKVISLPDSPVKLAHKRHHDIGYNPNNHIRRRELTELLDTHQCNGCGVKFKTISLLERHVKKCAKKEKFKELHPLKSAIMEESLARLKHTCFYCSKNFTYPKSLINHFQEFCPVKKEKIDKELLTENEKEKEQEMVHALKLQEEEKLKKTEGTESHIVKKRLGWPKGVKRKSKKKGHAWTSIKRRKSANDGDKLDVADSGTVPDLAKKSESEGKDGHSEGTESDYSDFTLRDICIVENNDLPKEKESIKENGTAIEDSKKDVKIPCDKNETLKKDALKSSQIISAKPKQKQDSIVKKTLSQEQEEFSEKGKLKAKMLGAKKKLVK
ncbi:hypothetical protein CHS0354_000246 [Potamilus streckersoni]|uniref:Uncharacterized protein n=1 Tax=Potamilus streckersoni TaxID=2493646 RepID=A0AAE0SMH7_9BIVA|nr:hypothetical protein CHS0354_000246 [Potamilus streckersoni]